MSVYAASMIMCKRSKGGSRRKVEVRDGPGKVRANVAAQARSLKLK